MKPCYETCDGCRSLVENRDRDDICPDLASLKYNERAKTCPCSICIVKSTCFSGCDEFDLFIMEMHGLNERIQHEEKIESHAIDSDDSGGDGGTV